MTRSLFLASLPAVLEVATAKDQLDALRQSTFTDAVNERARLWRTKDGREYRITEMLDGHLDNTIKYLARRGYASALSLVLGEDTPAARAEVVMLPITPVVLRQYENMLQEQEDRRKKRAQVHVDEEPECDAG